MGVRISGVTAMVRAVTAGGQRVRATWVPSAASRYRRAGGPWDVPTLDALISASGGEILDVDNRLSHDQVEALVARVAGGLLRRGVGRGSAVAWQLPNGFAVSVLFRACWRLGAAAVPILMSLGPTDRERALAGVEPVEFLELSADEVRTPEGLLAHLDGPPVPPSSRPLSGSDVAVILFTSGSAGQPKAVLHTQRGLSYKATLMARVHGVGRADAILMPAPQAHVSGLLNGVLLPGAAGMRAVLLGRFDPERALDLVETERISFMAGPPTFFVAMTEQMKGRTREVSAVKLISTGGASITPAFVETTAQVFGCRVKRTYGSTEAPTVTTSTNDDPIEKSRDTDGRAVGEVELRIIEPTTGARMGPGEPGELWVRGPELFAGYRDPDQTAAALAPGGWFRTGDLGTVDPEGWLTIVGRLKDIIIRGGENISASEVEAILEAHPAISQAVAVGYPDPLMGERVAAFVVSDRPFDLEDCRQWFAERGAAKFKTPERVHRLDALPQLGSGKADRAALKTLAETSH
jgi:cyclohexanecarboxylate-CoA ligase